MLTGMNWFAVSDQNPSAMALYRRHYSKYKYKDNRRHEGGIMPPGEHLLLMTTDGLSIFGWLYQTIERRDKQNGVCCTIFRNEGTQLSSGLIAEAMELAWERWPGERLWTYVDATKIRSSNPGYCFKQAGWQKAGTSKVNNLLIFEVMPLHVEEPR
mgnify:CR=1 FL=1